MNTTQTSNDARVTAPHDSGDGARVLFGAGGLIAVVLGVFVLFAPKTTAGAAMVLIAALIGAYAIVTGVVYFAIAFMSRSIGVWSRIGHVLLGLIYAASGAIIMSNLMFAGTVTAIMLSIFIGITWVIEAVVAFATAAKTQNKAFAIIYGILSLLAGATLLISPLMGAVTLWWLLGISMLVLGVAQIIRAFRS